jgi:hypothetical protein
MSGSVGREEAVQLCPFWILYRITQTEFFSVGQKCLGTKISQSPQKQNQMEVAGVALPWPDIDQQYILDESLCFIDLFMGQQIILLV